jgi:hypothetical protein
MKREGKGSDRNRNRKNIERSGKVSPKARRKVKFVEK